MKTPDSELLLPHRHHTNSMTEDGAGGIFVSTGTSESSSFFQPNVVGSRTIGSRTKSLIIVDVPYESLLPKHLKFLEVSLFRCLHSVWKGANEALSAEENCPGSFFLQNNEHRNSSHIETISIKTRMSLLRALVTLVFLYGCATWTLNAEMEKRINSFEMNCMCRLLQDHYTFHTFNKQIRELMTSYIGEHEHLLIIVKRKQLTWFGHVIRWKGTLANTCCREAQMAVQREEDL